MSKIIKTGNIDNYMDMFHPECVVLDCDGTLYPEIGTAREIFNDLLSEYLKNKFKYSRRQVLRFLSDNKLRFSTVSEIAACLLWGIDENELNKNVIEKMPLERIGIKRAFEWHRILKHDVPIIIFTNNSSFFARLIAKRLGIFEGVSKIFGEKELSCKRKPEIETFGRIVSFLEDKNNILYFDDDDSCLSVGKKLGWHAVKPIFGNSIVDMSACVDGFLIENYGLSK